MDLRHLAIAGTTIQHIDHIRIVSGRYADADGIAESVVVEFLIEGERAFEVCVLSEKPIGLNHVRMISATLPAIPTEDGI